MGVKQGRRRFPESAQKPQSQNPKPYTLKPILRSPTLPYPTPDSGYVGQLQLTPGQEEIEAAREARKKFDLCPGFIKRKV